MDGGNFGYDQASPASRPALYVSKVSFAHRAVQIPEIGPHGGHDCPVRQLQRFYLDRGKKIWKEIQGFSFSVRYFVAFLLMARRIYAPLLIFTL
jgi:hypothetical protein